MGELCKGVELSWGGSVTNVELSLHNEYPIVLSLPRLLSGGDYWQEGQQARAGNSEGVEEGGGRREEGK